MLAAIYNSTYPLHNDGKTLHVLIWLMSLVSPTDPQRQQRESLLATILFLIFSYSVHVMQSNFMFWWRLNFFLCFVTWAVVFVWQSNIFYCNQKTKCYRTDQTSRFIGNQVERRASSEDPFQTAQMRSLIWAFTARTVFLSVLPYLSYEGQALAKLCR